VHRESKLKDMPAMGSCVKKWDEARLGTVVAVNVGQKGDKITIRWRSDGKEKTLSKDQVYAVTIVSYL
jgi:hypothetical protein